MCCVIAAYCFEVSRDFLVTETNDEVEFKIKRDLSVSEVWLWFYEVIALELRSQVPTLCWTLIHEYLNQLLPALNQISSTITPKLWRMNLVDCTRSHLTP
jgi:hypothetical protein